MKRVLLIGLLLIVGCSKEPINYETLIEKDGLKYHPETKELYSGKVFQNRMGGEKEFEGSYKDGEKDGLWTWWYEDGQKRKEETYKDGKRDGLLTGWYENGQKWYEEIYKYGELDGKSTFWYKNGQKGYEKTYKDGKKISSKNWDEDGNLEE
jgi:antitoxin component YwqK of YwqJK toxin-antitoxin module